MPPNAALPKGASISDFPDLWAKKQGKGVDDLHRSIELAFDIFGFKAVSWDVITHKEAKRRLKDKHESLVLMAVGAGAEKYKGKKSRAPM